MKEAEVQAKIINNTIYINTSGTNGITIRVPPYVRKDNDVTIIINGITRLFKNDQLPDEIHVKVSDDNWEINTFVSCHSAKGTGLLEVYCHPLEILYNSHVLEGVAENFAHPKCTGFNPKLLVDYPIEYLHDYEYNIGENSFIILEDVLSDLEKFDCIRTASLIQYDTTGYEWKGKRYDEDYCIWQIIQHPYNDEQYILLISSNNWGYFKRFLFLRNIILLTYLHGNHPYLNNELLLLTKHGIYAMYESGENL